MGILHTFQKKRMGILITGATGLIGSKILGICQERNIEVNYLTTRSSKINLGKNCRGFYWNPKEKVIDPACLTGVDAIINLAGANLFRRWTKSYKKKLLESRTASLELLFTALKENENQVNQLVSASAIGIYPSSYQKIYNEDAEMDKVSFLGKLVREWETSADRFSSLGIDVAKIRTGMVLAKKGGALPIFKLTTNSFLGSALGTGKQWYSWIHIDDIARLFLFAVTHNLDGVYNAVAPNPVTNEELVHAVAAHLDKAVWLPKIPAFALRAVLGQMGEIALSSQLVESKKIEEMGFQFYYTNMNKALEDLL